MDSSPENEIVSSFTHPQVFSNLSECVCSAEHNGRYSEESMKHSIFLLLWKSMMSQKA